MKSIFEYFVKMGRKQSFQPNLISIFVNPGLFIRWFLFVEIRRLAPNLNGKVLDFGCGRKPYKNLFKNCDEYIGLDIEVSGHPHILSQVDVYYDGTKIPFDDNYFDSVFCGEVLEHVFNLEEVLIEINRVLKFGGKAIFTFPFAYEEHEKPFDYARYTSFAAKYIFEKNGFEILEQKKTGHFVIVLVQLWINYVRSLFATKNLFWNSILTLIFITPFNLIGMLCFLFPKNKDLYFSNIIYVKK